MQTATTYTPADTKQYGELVEKIKRKNPAALEELYGMVKNFTYFLMRQLGTEDLQDNLHDMYLTVAQAITAGKLRDPERLTAFLTTVARFYTYTQIERRVQIRNRLTGLDTIDVPDQTNLEYRAYDKQKLTLVREILNQMPRLDREILRRFYFEDQTKEQICAEMQLTPTQFRNIKSQAKLALTQLGLRRLKGRRDPRPGRESFAPLFGSFSAEAA